MGDLPFSKEKQRRNEWGCVEGGARDSGEEGGENNKINKQIS